MRILGFSKKWYKLHLGVPMDERPTFTTFRMTRRDRDWGVGEVAQVVIKPRRKGGGERLGPAEIIAKEPRYMPRLLEKTGYPPITDNEVKRDGFRNYHIMWLWLFDTYGGQRLVSEPMNKLTLRWVRRNSDVGK